MGRIRYRRDAELSPRTRWIGGVLFASAIAAPFAVIGLVGDPTTEAEVAQTAPGFAIADPDRNRTPPGALPDLPTIDTVALGASTVAPVSVLHPVYEPSPPVNVALASTDSPAAPVRRLSARPAGPAKGAPAKLSAPSEDPAKLAAATPLVAKVRRTIAVLPQPATDAPIALPEEIKLEIAANFEDTLDLNAAKRREFQLRLKLMGYDPRGVDGIFGKQTRAAIRAAQRDLALPETGFLDSALIAEVRTATDAKLADYRLALRKRANQAKLAEARRRASTERARVPAAKNSPKCQRNASGEIKENQGFSCDWALLEESIGSLFRQGG